MESLPSSSSPSLPTETDHDEIDDGVIEDHSNNENQTQQERLPCVDSGDDNIVGNSNERHPHNDLPQPLLDTRSPSYSNNITSTLRRRRTEQVNRGQLLQGQFQNQLQQQSQGQGQSESQGQSQSQSQSQSQGQEQDSEREIVLPATNTTMSQKSLFVLRPVVHRYADLVCIGISVLAYLLETTMNAALAIFGIGVGVGLVLGDSFRAALPLMPAVQVPQQQQQSMAMANATTTATTATSPYLLPAQ